MSRILIASPVRQKPHILRRFLDSLLSLRIDGRHAFLFFDDNDDPESSAMLQNFHPYSAVVKCENPQPPYSDHQWSDALLDRVAGMKNIFIQEALRDGLVSHLFLVDSDLVLHPDTLMHLLAAKKDIISEVFWTEWKPGTGLLPNVWQEDMYTMSDEFLAQLHTPGVYRVGGLGACTLISRKALQAGVNFSKLYNLSLWGEDRHFCVRAVSLGFELWADTHCPPEHLYRD